MWPYRADLVFITEDELLVLESAIFLSPSGGLGARDGERGGGGVAVIR